MPSSPVADRHRPRRSAARGLARGSRALPLALLVLLGGCGGGPAPRLYVLEPPEPLVSPGAPALAAGAAGAGAVRGPDPALDALGIAVVTLPGYARDPRIATRVDAIGVTVDDDHRWAESPEEALTRVLLERLHHHSAASVLAEPWPRGFEPDARVEVAFDRLLRTPAGGADAAGRVLLLSGDGREVLAVQPFRLERAGTSTATEAFFVAVAALVDELARLAIETLRAGAQPA